MDAVSSGNGSRAVNCHNVIRYLSLKLTVAFDNL